MEHAIKTFLFWLCYSVVSSPILFGLGILAVIIAMLATKRVDRTARTKVRLSAIFAVVLVLSIVSISKMYRFQSHVVDPKAFELIESGMTQQQVLDILGAPSSEVFSAKDQMTYWKYNKRGVWELALISFDEAGLVRSKMLDR